MQRPSMDVTGCTAGVIHVPGGILVFKNRDLSGNYVRNRITAYQSTPHVYALKGVNLNTRALEGVSIGVNRHRVCIANTNIFASDAVTYDVLCERLLRETRAIDDVPRVVGDFLQRHTVQGGRILALSPKWGFLVEVLESQHRIQEIERNFVITNMFSLLPHPGVQSEIRMQSSINRLETANCMLRGIANIGQLKSMLRSHVPDKGELSICNHRQDGGGTESSHIIQIRGDYVGWSSLVGFPCENDYHTVQVF